MINLKDIFNLSSLLFAFDPYFFTTFSRTGFSQSHQFCNFRMLGLAARTASLISTFFTCFEDFPTCFLQHSFFLSHFLIYSGLGEGVPETTTKSKRTY